MLGAVVGFPTWNFGPKWGPVHPLGTWARPIAKGQRIFLLLPVFVYGFFPVIPLGGPCKGHFNVTAMLGAVVGSSTWNFGPKWDPIHPLGT